MIFVHISFSSPSFRYNISSKPPIHAQPHEHSARRCDCSSPTPHAKHGLTLPYDGFLRLQLRVTGYVCECAEADKSCATYVNRQPLSPSLLRMGMALNQC